MGRYAAIDIGTVTCRLLLADVDGEGLHELCRETAITNLGIGVDASGILGDGAIGRVEAQMGRFLRIIESFSRRDGIEADITAVATSATRDARNADEFCRRIGALGIRLQVIPGEREAALSFLGASSSFLGERLLVVDVGGGSTEVIAGIGGDAPVFRHSFDIGCRRVTERFLSSDPPHTSELDAAKAWVQAQMAPYFGEIAEAGFIPGRMVAVAGSATSVVSVHERMEVYDSSRVHKTVVDAATLDGVYATLRRPPLAARKQVVGLDPARAGVIVAGLLILKTVMEAAAMASFTVSEADILQGIVLDAAGQGLGSARSGPSPSD